MTEYVGIKTEKAQDPEQDCFGNKMKYLPLLHNNRT